MFHKNSWELFTPSVYKFFIKYFLVIFPTDLGISAVSSICLMNSACASFSTALALYISPKVVYFEIFRVFYISAFHPFSKNILGNFGQRLSFLVQLFHREIVYLLFFQVVAITYIVYNWQTVENCFHRGIKLNFVTFQFWNIHFVNLWPERTSAVLPTEITFCVSASSCLTKLSPSWGYLSEFYSFIYYDNKCH